MQLRENRSKLQEIFTKLLGFSPYPLEKLAEGIQKYLDQQKDASNLEVSYRKSYRREKRNRKITTNVTESEFRLYKALAERLWEMRLIREPTMYYFAGYAMKGLTDLVLAFVSDTQDTIQEAAKSEGSE